jgi:site-specific recombinase XerD
VVHIGGVPIDGEVTPMDVSDFITSNIKKEWGESVVNNRLGTLRTFFDFLYMGGVVNTVPPRFIRPRRRAKNLPTVLTSDQVEQFLERTTNLGNVLCWNFSTPVDIDRARRCCCGLGT